MKKSLNAKTKRSATRDLHAELREGMEALAVKSNPELTRESSQESIQTWAERVYIGSKLRRQLTKANALIVPNEGLGDQGDLLYFPEGTEEVLQFLKSSASDGLTVDIAIEEKDYKELSLRADWLMIAGFVV